MNISIIGAGNMAYFLATRLKKSGHCISCIYARRKSEADKLATLVNSTGTDNPSHLPSETDVFFFALPDLAIQEFVVNFAFHKSLKVHCAGTVPVEVFESKNAGVIWPLYSIKKELLPKVEDVPLFWEGVGQKGKEIISLLAQDLSKNCHEAGLEKRQELHLSAVFVNNFVNHIMTITAQRMQEINLPFKASLQPIIDETISLAMAGESARSQTGPAIRRDEGTMQRHLALIAQHPDWQDIYKAMSTSIQNFYPPVKQE